MTHVARRAVVPAVGTTVLGDASDDAGLFAGYTDPRTTQTYASRPGSGTFTVTDVSGGRLRGSFRITLYDAMNSSTITVAGTFDAQGL